MFHFKQFQVSDDRCAMKVGTDGVLLGAWADVSAANKILDIGTGCGLIALMLAQRSHPDARITAVEINDDAFGQACENILSSPWCDRVVAVHSSIQHFHPRDKFDLIVCNPPYFIDSLKPGESSRSQSRHASSSLPFSELLGAVKDLLHDSGRFCSILPYDEGKIFILEAGKNSLFCTKKIMVKSKAGKHAERVLLEFAHHSQVTKQDFLTIRDDEDYSKQYFDLVSPFYLKL